VDDEEALISAEAGQSAATRRERAGNWWRVRYEGSAAQDLVKGLDEVEFGNWIIMFGASFCSRSSR
jgi:hypothetical protein